MGSSDRSRGDRFSRGAWSSLVGLLLSLLLVVCGVAPAPAAEADRIAEVLRLEPGMTVADVGAGDGKWSAELAQRIGDSGHVYATEVDSEELEKIRTRVREEDLTNVTPILGDQQATGLPPACCDAILLRMVYHHFTDPAMMRADLSRALRPGGRLAIIDITPQEHWRRLPDVPQRGGHGILPEDLIREMTGDGFEVVGRYEDWKGDEDRYCVVFRRP